MLRRHREAAGLTQAELAERARLGVRTVSNLERGVNTSPYPSTVRLLADALGLSEPARRQLLAAAGRSKDPDRRRAIPPGGYLGAVPPTPLVARDAERAAIAAALDAVAAGTGQVMLLAGEPGIGKTRLAQQASVDARERGFLVAGGRCYEQQSQNPLAPWIEVFGALHQTAGIYSSGHIVERWPPLAALLSEQLPSVAPSPRPVADASQRLHHAATSLVRSLAEHRPVAILFDDLHWADDATVALLAHVARHASGDRVLLLGTYRDRELRAKHGVRRIVHSLQREGLAGVITVRRMDGDETAHLIAQRLDAASVSDELTELIHRQSDGNPFFTGELVTALVERGDLRRVAGHWVCRELAELEAPVSVSEAIVERVLRLSPAAQSVLADASVLGEVFDPDDLTSVDAAETVEHALDEAVACGLLDVVAGCYAFDHSLTQQTLYAGLSPARRRRLHRLVGERLERRPPAVRRRRSAEIARHLEAGGVPERALSFFLLAGDLAVERHAQDAAVRLYHQALEWADEVGDEAAAAAALERIGEVESRTARYDASLAHLTKAAEAHRRSQDVEARLRVEGTIAHVLHRRGEGEAAAQRLAEVVAELETSLGSDDPVPGVAALSNGLARVRLSLGQHQVAFEAAQDAARLARQEGSVAVEAAAYAAAGTALLFMDQPGEAVSTLERAVSLAASADALTAESEAILALSWTLTMQGELSRGLALGERGLAITRRSGDTDAEALHTADIGLAYFYAGDLDRAQGCLERSVELARAGSPTLYSGIPPAYLGLVLSAKGDLVAARSHYDEAATAPDLSTFAFDAYLDARLAELDLRAGHPESALARLEPWLGAEAPTRIHDVMLLSIAADTCLALDHVAHAEELVDQALRRAAATRNEVDRRGAMRIKGRCVMLRERAGDVGA